MSGLFETLADRVRTQCPSVGAARPATSVAEADSEPIGPVATVLVVPAAEGWRSPPSAGLIVSQSGRIGFTCIVGLAFPGGFSEWEAVRAELLAAFRGWTPPGVEAAEPVEFAGAQLIAFGAEEGGRWLHAFNFNFPAQATYEVQT